jgi:hypothetical protein
VLITVWLCEPALPLTVLGTGDKFASVAALSCGTWSLESLCRFPFICAHGFLCDLFSPSRFTGRPLNGDSTSAFNNSMHRLAVWPGNLVTVGRLRLRLPKHTRR